MIHAEGKSFKLRVSRRARTDEISDAEWQVKADGSNQFVFNTEAHPYLAPPPKPSYGSGKIGGGKRVKLPFTPTGKLPLVSPAPLLRGRPTN